MTRQRLMTWCAVMFVVAGACAWTLHAQTPPAQAAAQTPQTQRPPVFRADANFVQVDAYPMKDGRIVTNLEQTDFEILEDGKPQKIEAFELVKVQPFTPDAERRDPNTQEEGNTLAADAKNRLFVIYLDALNVSISGAHAARKPLVQMLNRILAPNDLFGVMSPDMKPKDLVFGRKVMTTEDMLERYWPWGQRHSILRTPQEESMTTCTRDPESGRDFFVREGAAERKMIDVLVDRSREDRVLRHLEELVEYLGSVRETRTSLVVFTEGWLLYEPDRALEAPLAKVLESRGGVPTVGLGPGGRLMSSTTGLPGSTSGCVIEVQRLANLSNRTRFRQLVEQAKRANVVFYPVNPSGLEVFDYPINQELYAPDPSQSVLLQSITRIEDRANALMEAAENTGGLAVVNTNNLNAGLERVANQLSAYYVMGYYSTNSKFDGRYRQIQVKLKVPGVSVTARRGYRAPTEAEMSGRNAPKPEPTAADATKDENAAALGVLSRIRPGADLYGWGVQTSPTELTVFAEVSPQLAEAGKWMDGAEFQVTLTTAAGEAVGGGRGRLDKLSRGASARVALPSGAVGPWSAQLRLKSDTEMIETSIAIGRAPGAAATLLSEPLIYRAAPGMRAALHPA
ncbi:MAG: VWA domain-containing protein, partial [Acidobacteria bacterium]|nr:VWA domain-containing protein [Acidobacteriota bacterium]